MINGVVAQKLQALDAVLAELRTLGIVSAKALRSDWQQRRAIERNLQVLVEVVIDVCQRLVTVTGQSPATSGADAIERCIQMGALTPDENYTRMVRFEAVSGRRLFIRDLPAAAAFVSLTAREYEDDMALIERGLRWRAELEAARANPAETAQQP